jgi:short-subunit dehydrogenase
VKNKRINILYFSPTNIKNIRSKTFQYDQGIDPEWVAKKIYKKIVNKRTGSFFIPSYYRFIHLIERLLPRFIDLLPKYNAPLYKKKRYRKIEIKSALITGATSGLGKELALEYGKRLKELYLVARNDLLLEKVKKEILNNSQCKVKTIKCDISSSKDIEDLSNCIKTVDLLINNAGIHLKGSVNMTSIDYFHKIFKTNFIGAVNLTTNFLRKSTRPKKIINILSTTAIAGRANLGAYGASKSALWSYTRSLRRMFGNNMQILEVILATFPSNLSKNGIIVEAPDMGNQITKDFQSNFPSPRKIALKIIEAENKGKDILIYPFIAKPFMIFEAILPRLFRYIF